MADNPFEKKFAKKGDEKKAPDGKNSPPPGRGEKSKGNPFARKMEGKHMPPKKKGKKRPAKKSRLQKFGQRY